METSRGVFEFETYPTEAPKTVARILELVKARFYNGMRIHRVVPGFVIQMGDPQTKTLPVTDPKVVTKIHMNLTVTGKAIPAAAVERAIAMSHEKYCSASIMLGKTAEITTSFDLLEPGA